jgi:hypothetical protein
MVGVVASLLIILGALAAVVPTEGDRDRRERVGARPSAPGVPVSPRPDSAVTKPASDPEPSPELEAARREDAARRALENARAYGRSNAADLPGRISKFEQAAWECRGTILAGEARREHAALQKERADQLAAEIAPAVARASAVADAGRFAEAIALVRKEQGRLAGADWISAIEQKVLQIRQKADQAFLPLKDQAVQFRRRGDEGEVGKAVALVRSWGLEDLNEQLAATLAAVPRPEKPADPVARAYLDAWDAAFGFARLRDYAGAQKALEAGAAPLRDPGAKAECVADQETLRLLASALSDVQQGLLHAPKGQKVSVEVEAAGTPVRVEGSIVRQGPTWLEVQTDAESVMVDVDDLTAGSFRELLGKLPGRKNEADRLGALMALLEGEPVDLSVLPPGAVPPRFVEFGARVAEEKGRADMAAKESQARARFEAAERQFGDPASRMESFESYRALLSAFPESTLVRRKRMLIAQRLDAEKEAGKEYLISPAQMRTAGAFRPASYARVANCWTSAADVPPEKDNYVEFTFFARAGLEYRCWVYVGGCCAETFAFDVQRTDLGVDAGGTTRLPVKNSILFLKKTHAAHGGRKEPSRFEWVAVPLQKSSAAGPKTVRLLSTQQGFSVAYAVVSALRTAAPGDAQMKEWERGQPAFASAGTADPALVAWWTLDEGHGNVVSDSSLNRIAGVLRNEPIWTSGKRRGALSFNGVGDYVEIPKVPKLYIPGPFTVAGWLNPTALPKSEWGMYAVSDYSADGGLCTFSVRVMSTGAVQFFWQTDKVERSIAMSSGCLPPGAWTHVAGVWDGTVKTVYINGVPDGVCKDPQPRPDVGGNVAIGRPGSFNGLYFNGRIDDVRIYGRALLSPEIRALAGR